MVVQVEPYREQLTDFASRFRPRLVEMTGDIDDQVAESVLGLLQLLVPFEILTDSDIISIENAIFVDSLDVRRAAAKFLITDMPCFEEPLETKKGKRAEAERKQQQFEQLRGLADLAARHRHADDFEWRTVGFVIDAFWDCDENEARTGMASRNDDACSIASPSE